MNITAEHINLRDAWPSGFAKPPKNLTLLAGCRLLHGPGAVFVVASETITCSGNPTQPPLVLQKEGARYFLVNHNPRHISDLSIPVTWPAPPLDMPMASIMPLPGGGYQLSGTIRHKGAVPWDGFRFYVLDPAGIGAPKGSCIRGSVKSKQPLNPGNMRLFTCSLEQKYVTVTGDKAELWVASGYQKHGEPTALTALRLSPSRVSLPLPQHPVVLLSPGTTYKAMENNRPAKPFALTTHTVARIAGTRGSYYMVEPHPPWPFPGDQLFVRGKFSSGKARIMQQLRQAIPPPKSIRLNPEPKQGTPLAAVPQSQTENDIWLAVSQTSEQTGPRLQWYDCTEEKDSYNCHVNPQLSPLTTP